MLYRFEHRSTLKVSQQRLFEFHTDTNNLAHITPPGIHVDVLAIETPVQKDSTVTLHIRKGWFGFRWELSFETIDPNGLIVDVATRSPFKSFRHEHHCIALDASRSALHDIVTFELAFDPLSRVVAPFILRDMKQMFAYRHEKTAALLH